MSRDDETCISDKSESWLISCNSYSIDFRSFLCPKFSLSVSFFSFEFLIIGIVRRSSLWSFHWEFQFGELYTLLIVLPIQLLSLSSSFVCHHKHQLLCSDKQFNENINFCTKKKMWIKSLNISKKYFILIRFGMFEPISCYSGTSYSGTMARKDQMICWK